MGAIKTPLSPGYERGIMARSIMEPSGAYECYHCGDTRNLEEHHIFFGEKHRKLSEHYGLKVHLCHGCHRYAKTGVHGGNKELDAELKQEAQELFEEKYSHELFMKVFQKNYITEKKQPIEPGFIWLPEEE